VTSFEKYGRHRKVWLNGLLRGEVGCDLAMVKVEARSTTPASDIKRAASLWPSGGP